MKRDLLTNILTLVLTLTTGPAVAATEYVSAITTEATFTGVADSDRAGYSIANAGDVNCDGIDDMLIGAPYQEADDGADNVGKVYLIYGGSGSSRVSGDQDLMSVADAVFEGEQGEDQYGNVYDDANAGYAVSGAGDINGDGCDDFLIGAPGQFNSAHDYPQGLGAGKVYLLLGKSGASAWSGAVSLEDSTYQWKGSYGDSLGEQVAPAGDVNGDGYDDVLLYAKGYRSDAASYDEAFAGKVYLIYGPASLTDTELVNEDSEEQCETAARGYCVVFTGEAGADYAGQRMTHGDLNADGYDDVIISAPGADKTYLLYGGRLKLAGKNLADANATFTNVGSDACVGDLNGDGKVELVMTNSSYGPDSSRIYAGRGYMINGKASASIRTISSAISSGSMATSTTTLKTNTKYSGGYDLTTSSIVKATFLGDGYDKAGGRISCDGDTNGDGADDVLIGAEAYAGNTNKTYLLYGDAFSGEIDLAAESSVVSFTEEAYLDEMGSDVTITGDYNGDGLADLLMSAVQTYATYSGGPGVTYLYYGY